MEDDALVTRGVTRRFGGLVAVSDVSIRVRAGARHGIIGPNGAGKTTLFNVVTGELKATAGTVELLGTEITSVRAAARARLGLARTYQVTRTFSRLTVRDNLALGVFGLRRAKFAMLRPWRTYADVARAVEDAAERFSLGDRLDEPAGELSHGEVRLLEVALAMGLRPRVLMLDEPGAGLSPAERVMMSTLLASLPADLTLVMIEHDMDLVRDVVETASVLHYGAVVADGPIASVQTDPLVREIYLGST